MLLDDLNGYLLQLGEQPIAAGASLRFYHGSAAIEVAVSGNEGSADSRVVITAFVLGRDSINLDLAMWLLKANAQLPFGGFCLDQNQSVFLRHILFGAGLSFEAFQAAVQPLLSGANGFDDLLKESYDGYTAFDLSSAQARGAEVWFAAPVM